jgi:hypothetical protein
VVKKGSALTFEYAIADHQGNTRVVFTAEAPQGIETTTDFESDNPGFANDDVNRSAQPVMNHSVGGTYSQLLNGGPSSQVGSALSFKVYPGDKVKAEVYAKYWEGTGMTGELSAFASALTAAFGLSESSPGEMLEVFQGLNDFGTFIANGDRPDDEESPKGFVTILLFDKDHNFLDAAWDQLEEGYTQTDIVTNDPFDHLEQEITVKQAGFAYVFVSNEHPQQLDIHFDDLKVTHTPSNIVQYNEYYPFGLQTENSWTREDSNNAYLYNAGSELNRAGSTIHKVNSSLIVGEMEMTKSFRLTVQNGHVI